jgi:xylitol oxidase
MEAALPPFEARPHRGNLLAARALAIAPIYERAGDFAPLAARLDPRGALRNAWLEERVLGPAGR